MQTTAGGARLAIAVLVAAAAAAAVCVPATRAEAPAPQVTAAGPLQLIVAPARLRPGQSANVHVADTSRRGDVAARICARSGAAAAVCRDVRLQPGQVRTRTRLRLPRAGTWTVTLRSPGTTAVQRRVEVGPNARYRVLVTGDSMVFGVIDVLARVVRRTGGALTGDANPGTGITKPALGWPDHARALARRERPDVTVVALGAAVDAFPLTTAAGPAECCGPEWVDEYARRLQEVMAAYLRRGSGVVYWVLLPAPRDVRRVEIRAINEAIERAAATFHDGIAIVDIRPAISPGGRFRATAIYRGRRAKIREDDGIHLANAGVHIACEVILRAMRRDGLLR